MALSREKKEQVIQQVSAVAQSALSLVVADSRGVDAVAITDLRAKCRELDVQTFVVKNTLAKIAFKETEYECVLDRLVGPSLFAFSMTDPGAGARLFKDMQTNVDAFSVSYLAVGESVYEGVDLDKLAKLPTLEQALAMLCNVSLAPVTKLVRTLNEVPSQIVRVIDQVGKSKVA